MSAPLTILISGQGGQVATALQHRLSAIARLIVPPRHELDLAQPQMIRQQIRSIRPDLIINAAAYTRVDQAQSEPEQAFAINAGAPGMFAEQAFELGIPLIHYSTDYVFDGKQERPYVESDTPRPLNVYGASKWAGEQAITAVGGQHLILRTSWVYSRHGHNFLLSMLRLLQTQPQVRVVVDQLGAPTWAETLAISTRALIERWQSGHQGAWGTYHLSAAGETSWFGFAQAIADHLRERQRPCAELRPIPSSDYPTPAPRPLNSRLDCRLLQQQWQVSQPDWQDALRECLAEPA